MNLEPRAARSAHPAPLKNFQEIPIIMIQIGCQYVFIVYDYQLNILPQYIMIYAAPGETFPGKFLQAHGNSEISEK